MIELDAFEAFMDAMMELDREASGRELGRVLSQLYRNGWRITRQQPALIEPPVHEPPPAAIAPASDASWPPPGITKLWAFFKSGDLYQIKDFDSLCLSMRIDISIIEAATEEEAKANSNSLSILTRKSFVYRDETFIYMTDEIPF